MKSLNSIFQREEAKFAQKSLDYYDGKQLPHVIEMLDEPDSGRAQWKKRGIKPIFRNITKKIVNKSGLLFINGIPTIELWRNGTPDEKASAILNEALDDADFGEFLINFDSVVRLLKTALVLIQYNQENDSLVFDTLHRGNCIVKTDPITKKINQLIYKTGEDELDENECNYTIFTPTTIELWTEKYSDGAEAVLTSSVDNPYGVVPASVFYDTTTPRTGFWIEAPKELIMFNELLNIHYIDLNFASAFAVHQTLFTNCSIEGEQYSTDTDSPFGSVLPRQGGTTQAMVGGLGKIVYLDTSGVESPFVEYKGPNVVLSDSHELYKDWCRDYAEDWSVTVKLEGDNTSNVSGFSLVVQEKDNLELRKERQRMFEAGLQRMCRMAMHVINTAKPNTFSPDLEVFVDFADPVLPFNPKDEEDVWSMKIAEGRASTIDYLMSVEDLSREEAILRLHEIQNDNSGMFDLPQQ